MATDEVSERTPRKVKVPGRFKCEVCGKVFRHNSNLFEHRSVHTGFTPYACPYCSKACRLKGNLKKHMRTHVTTSEELEAAWRPFAREARSDSPFRLTKTKYVAERGERSSSEELGSDETGESSNISEMSGDTASWEITQERTDRWVDLLREGKILPQVQIEDKLRQLLDAIEVNKTVEEVFGSARSISFESFRCPTCSETFISQEEYTKHSHTLPVADDYHCKHCQRTFQNKGYFLQHASYHEKVKEWLDIGFIQPSYPDFLIPTPDEVDILLAEGAVNN